MKSAVRLTLKAMTNGAKIDASHPEGGGKVKELRELRKGQCFHDPNLGIVGKVISQNGGSVTVRYEKRCKVQITDKAGCVVREFKATRRRVTTVSPGWLVEEGRK